MTKRERFERWARRRDMDLKRDGEGYFYTGTREAWLAWKAASVR